MAAVPIYLALLPFFAIIFGIYLFSNAFLAAIVYHLGIIFCFIVFRKHIHFHKVFRGWDLKSGLLLIILGFCAGFTVYILWKYIALDGIDIYLKLGSIGMNDLIWKIFIIYYIIVNPPLEELFWRDLLSKETDIGFLFDILYAGYHIFVVVLFIKVFWVLITFIILYSVGYIWRRISNRNKGLLIPYLSHLAGDISLMIAVYVIGSGLAFLHF